MKYKRKYAFILIGIAALMICVFAVPAAYDALSKLWGITEKTYPYAPQWLKIYVGYGAEIMTAAGGAISWIMIAVGAKLLKMPLSSDGKDLAKGALTGTAATVPMILALIASDSIRVISVRPHPAQLIAAAAAVCAVYPPMLFFTVLSPKDGSRVLPVISAIVYACAVRLMYYGSPMSVVNRALAAYICFAAGSAAYSFGFMISSELFGFVFGLNGPFFNSAYSLIETCTVSEYALTGGNSGIFASAALTVILAGIIAYRHLKKHKKQTKSKMPSRGR